MSIALVTNYLPPYRLPLYELLAEHLGLEVYCFGGEARYVPPSLRDLDAQLGAATFPAHRLRHQRDAGRIASSHKAVIAVTAGRIALPAAFRGAQLATKPFLLWASLWRHPRTVAHAASYPFMRRIYRRADAILTYGTHVSQYVARQRGTKEGVFVAPQAVEREIFGREVDQAEVDRFRAGIGVPKDGGPILLYVGRLVREKGVEVLLGAWQRIGARTDATLCIVGDGELAGRARKTRGVRLAGRLPRERLPVAYAAADALVVPSGRTRHFLEPWGLVCNEAMLQGTPVIASDAVGAAAGGLVRDEDTGLVVPAGDAVALARAVEGLLNSPGLRASLAASALKAVRSFSYEAAADAFVKALESAGAGP